MLYMGDEIRRTQNGNNNDYCHDDETNWLDWSLLTKHADVHRFVSLLNKRRPVRNGIRERLTLYGKTCAISLSVRSIIT